MKHRLYCDGKLKYDKKGAMSVVNKRYKEDHVKLRIYPCRDHWHVTKLLDGKYNKYKRR